MMIDDDVSDDDGLHHSSSKSTAYPPNHWSIDIFYQISMASSDLYDRDRLLRFVILQLVNECLVVVVRMIHALGKHSIVGFHFRQNVPMQKYVTDSLESWIVVVYNSKYPLYLVWW